MACKNCQCQTEDVKEQTVSETEFNTDVLLRQSVKNMYRIDDLDAHVGAIESFLISKFPGELGPEDCPLGTQQWLDAKERAKAREQRLSFNIKELESNGYIIAKKEPPAEPTLETSIREVVLANTIIK